MRTISSNPLYSADRALFFEKDDLPTAKCKRPGDGEANHPCPDDNDFDFEHVFTSGARRSSGKRRQLE